MLLTTTTHAPQWQTQSSCTHSFGQQAGAVLVTGLILMSVLTILVVSAVSSTILQERMAGNARDRQIAFQRAEQAFTIAEATFSAPPFEPFNEAAFTTSCANGYCRSAIEDPDWASVVDWAATSTTSKDAGDGARYAVKYLGKAYEASGGICDIMLHITARAPGDNANTIITLQTTERLRVGGCLTSF